MVYGIEYNEGDKINCCIMEIRQDGMAIVSISPDLLEAATKLKKKKRKKSSTGDSNVLSKNRKLQLAEVSHHSLLGYIVTVTTYITVTVRQYSNGTC